MAMNLCNSLVRAVSYQSQSTLLRKSVGRRCRFSTITLLLKDPKFDDIFPHVRKSTRLSPEEYKKIEAYVEKDLMSPTVNEDDEDEEELSQMFIDKRDSPDAYDDHGDIVSNQFWENAFNSSYTMKKLDAPEKPKKLKQTFMNMGEMEPWEQEGMLPDDDDDLTSLGHGELERHRELRHYARLAAWEMPLLYNLRKPFVPPTNNMPLRFRYTTYMGEQHPAENKVVLEFSPMDIPDLTDNQRQKMRKLAGVRWNPELDLVKMSCESYQTQAQNKRYLGDTFALLLKESKDTKDDMADIPLYTKYHSFKKIPRFPQEWIMTDERQKELENHRKELASKDKHLEKQGLLIDGVQCVKNMLEGIDNLSPVNPTKVPLAGGSPAKTIAIKRQ